MPSRLLTTNLTNPPHFNIKDERCRKSSYDLAFTLTVAFDPIRTLSQKSWKLSQLLSQNISRVCALSEQTTVELMLPEKKSGWSLVQGVEGVRTDKSVKWTLDGVDLKKFDIGIEWDNNTIDYGTNHLTSVLKFSN